MSLPVWISFMETALRGVPVFEPAAPEGVVNLSGEWYYNEYARGAGVTSVGGSSDKPAVRAMPPPDERRSILDLFRN